MFVTGDQLSETAHLSPLIFHRTHLFLDITIPVNRIAFLTLAALIPVATSVRADDGYRLWLRYEPVTAPKIQEYNKEITAIVAPGASPTQTVIRRELLQGCAGLLMHAVQTSDKVTRDGAVMVGTKSSPHIAKLGLDKQIAAAGPDGFIIRSVKIGAHATTVIAANSEAGALYGSFHFLRLLQTQQPLANLNISQKPSFQRRVLNHWDNLDGSIERGYAGKSIWDWEALPGKIDNRLVDYARANASVGINGAVLNNVNASTKSLTPEYLQKTKAIADTLRPYGIRVYLSARFDAPIALGKLKTADPLDPKVISWWKAKSDEIYKLIPDFGGYLVKANSEGQPGPLTYGRTHADGANMLAAAVAPHKGVVMWRAFVYEPKPNSDRVGQAYEALKPFDGQFASNVLLQVKNGPLDFMPREPFHPLFGAMPKTQLMPEVQITQEYLGQSNFLAYLAPMWREFLDSDTYAKGAGSTVAKMVDGTLTGQKLTGIAGVANVGNNRNWTGHHLAQSNWYAFGRLAWNDATSSQQIAREWSEMTFTHDSNAVGALSRMLLGSRENVVNAMMPLGLTHIISAKDHYGPEPNRAAARNFHRADSLGLGFDRTATGSNTVSQYNSGARERFASLANCPEELLLWFHHVPWDHKMRSGRTLWDELCLRYQGGLDGVATSGREWKALEKFIDPERHAAVAAKFVIQERDSKVWRDTCLPYFQTFSKRPFPAGVDAPPAPAAPDKEVLPLNFFRNLKAGRPQTLVVYGTSLTANGQWARDLKGYMEKEFPGQVTFVNSARAGMASNWGAQHFQERVLDKKPDLVFLEFSMNDASKNNSTSVAKARANLDSMVKALRAQNPQAEIVLQTMNAAWDSTVSAPKKYGSDRPKLADYYDVYRHYAWENGLALIDNNSVWLKLQNEDVEKYHEMVPDGIHPSPAASTAVTWKAVGDLLGKARTAANAQQAVDGRSATTSAVVLPANKEQFHLYLLLGQSNMVGRDTKTMDAQGNDPHVLNLNGEGEWVIARDPIHPFDGKIASGVGPGLSFALEMAKADPTATIGLIPCAVGGTHLSRWVKGADLYENAIKRAKLASKFGVIKGVLWHQGEAETAKIENANSYQSRLTQMFKDLRADLNSPDLPIVVGQLGVFLNPKHVYAATVRDAIKNMPNALVHVGYADSVGLGHKGDSVHFSADAERELGKRYAAAMMGLGH